jgi:hypothetical protein
MDAYVEVRPSSGVNVRQGRVMIGPCFVNLVQNGKFSDISGMGVTGGGWYNNIPPMWATDSEIANGGYSVLLLEGKYYANLNTLSVTEGTNFVTTKFLPLYQEIAPRPTQRTLTATWTIRSLNGFPYHMGAAFYEGKLALNNFVAVYNSPLDANTRIVSLVARNFPANTLITFAMWQSGTNAPGVSDLTIYSHCCTAPPNVVGGNGQLAREA